MAAKNPTREQGSRSPAASPSRPISHLLAVAATLLSVPGVILYFGVLLGLQLFDISLQGNLMAPLLLAFTGMGLWLLALTGVLAVLWQLLWCRKIDPLMKLCLWTNSLILLGMLVLVIFIPQFE